jgi:hypothetical protein
MNRKPLSSWSRTLRLSLGALALGAASQASAELVLHENDDFSGRSFRAYVQVVDLSTMNFNDRASSVVVRSGAWQLCSDSNFRGQCITLSPGSYGSLREFGINDRVSSVRPAGFGGSGNSGNSGGGGNGGWGGGWGGSNAAVQMFEHADYAGRSISSNGTANLANQGFNDRVSSIVIRSGRWEFCSDADYRGRCVTLGPGSYGKLDSYDLNDAISSLRAGGSGGGYGGGGYGGNRPGGWSGDDGSAPQVVMAGRSGRVVFDNGCIAYYNNNGQRFQNLPACHGNQVRRADEAMASYRREQGLEGSVANEHPWSNDSGYGANDNSPPEIIAGTNREAEVIFRNNCVVYFNAQGRRYQQQPSCNPGQLRRAEVAMSAYRREQGW